MSARFSSSSIDHDDLTRRGGHDAGFLFKSRLTSKSSLRDGTTGSAGDFQEVWAADSDEEADTSGKSPILLADDSSPEEKRKRPIILAVDSSPDEMRKPPILLAVDSSPDEKDSNWRSNRGRNDDSDDDVVVLQDSSTTSSPSKSPKVNFNVSLDSALVSPLHPSENLPSSFCDADDSRRRRCSPNTSSSNSTLERSKSPAARRRRNAFALSQADVTESHFHDDDDDDEKEQEVEKLIIGVDSFIVDDSLPSSSSDEEPSAADSSKKKKSKRTKKRRDDTIDIDSDELNDLEEMNGSLLRGATTTGKKKSSSAAATSSSATGSKVRQRGKRIFMMQDSSSEEEDPAKKLDDVVQVDSSSSSGEDEPECLKAITAEEFNNTYDYNDSFINDDDDQDVSSPGGGGDQSSDSTYEFSEKDAATSSSDSGSDDPEVVTLDDDDDKPPTRRRAKAQPPPPPKNKKTSPPPPSVKAKKHLGSKTMTFLESLSLAKNDEEEIDFTRCHPDAVKYLKQYNRNKTDLAKYLYDLYNRDAFDSQLPREMEMIWCPRLTKTAGTCVLKGKMKKSKDSVAWTERSCRIKLSVKVLDSADRLRDTLVHEMCHAAAWLVSECRGGHGPVWKSWAGRAMKRLPELPIISRCHAYEIRTKYTYRCTGCNSTYGRHSKSIDTDKKCCGKCRGRLTLENNSSSGKGMLQQQGNGAAAKAPSTPNAFAMFVKDKYKTCRTPGVSHGDAMKQISAMFAKTKISK